MISGNPSSKCQRVWLVIRRTLTQVYMQKVKGTDFLIGYAVACSSSHARVQEFLSGKLQVCKVLGGVSSIFQVVHLQISMETYRTCDYPRGWGSRPQPSFGSAHASSSKLSSSYLHIFHSVLNHFTRLYKVST